MGVFIFVLYLSAKGVLGDLENHDEVGRDMIGPWVEKRLGTQVRVQRERPAEGQAGHVRKVQSLWNTLLEEDGVTLAPERKGKGRWSDIDMVTREAKVLYR